MAHYALLDENNVVVNVIVGADETDTENLGEEFSSWEEFYADFFGQTCKRTSYNTFHNQHDLGGTPFRGNYAAIGKVYDAVNDIFIEAQPYDSWTLDLDNAKWVAPISKPDSEQQYTWNESAYQADNSTGWEAVE